MAELRKYEPLYSVNRDKKLAKVQEAYERFKETKTFEFPQWLYGAPIGKLIKVEVEDCPNFGDTAYVEMDSARTAFIAVDMQTDFCGKKGYVDVMGYDLNNTARALEPIANALEAVRGTDIKVIHTREGHEPDLSDARSTRSCAVRSSVKALASATCRKTASDGCWCAASRTGTCTKRFTPSRAK